MAMTNSLRMMLLSGAVSAAAVLQSACTHHDYAYQQQGQSAPAAYPAPAPTYAPAPVYATADAPPAYQPLTAAQLDQLTGPIALYADPLLAQLLPAATYPADIQTAAAWLAATAQPSEDAINAQPWDPSVKAIVHYPTVLQMMNDRLDWTQALGTAFVYQQPDVMASIQRLRLQAQAAGSLQSTPQQEVILVDNYVRVLPVEPTVIYVPVYDPQVVYVVRRPGFGPPPVISFGTGFAVGVWLSNDTDWHDHRVMERGDWRRDVRSEREHRGGRETNNVIVKNNTTIVNNNTSVKVGQTGGRAWARNTAKPQPVMPATVAHQLGVQPRPDSRNTKPAPASVRPTDNRTSSPPPKITTPPAPAPVFAPPKPTPPNVAPPPPQPSPRVVPVEPTAPAPKAPEPRDRVAPPTPPAPKLVPPKDAPPPVAPPAPKIQPPKPAPPAEAPKAEPPKRVPPPETPKIEPPKRVPPPEAPKIEPPKPARPTEAPKIEPPKRVPPPEAPKIEPPKPAPPPEAPKIEPPKPAPPPEAPKIEPPKPAPPPEAPKIEPPKRVPPSERPAPPPEAPRVEPKHPAPPADAPKVEPPAKEPPKDPKDKDKDKQPP